MIGVGAPGGDGGDASGVLPAPGVPGPGGGGLFAVGQPGVTGLAEVVP